MGQISNYLEADRILKNIDKAENKNRADGSMSRKQRDEEIDKAFMGFSSACVDNPEFALAYYKRGKCYMLMYDYKRALYDFSSAFFNQDRLESK